MSPRDRSPEARRRRRRRALLVVVGTVVVGAVGGYGYTRTRPFGELPSGERLARAEESPQWRDGRFHNPQRNSIDLLGALWTSITGAGDEATPSTQPAYVRTDPAALAQAPSSGLRVT